MAELLEGETLRDRLGGGPVPVRKAIEYAIQIAHGLAAAHDKGIVHRDLKPENLFIAADGHVKILDFGLAKLTQSDTLLVGATNVATLPVAQRTQAGLVLGTIGYMAPEQVRGQAVDQRADIFGFGTILYEMLSGKRAFPGDTAIDAMTAILKENPADLPVAERHITPALARIVDRCLEKSSTNRFQSAGDLAFALEGLSVSSDVVGPLHRPQERRRGERPKTPVSERLLWLAATAVLCTTALFLGRSIAGVVEDAREVIRFEIPVPVSASFIGGSTGPVASPDGRYLAFITTNTQSSNDTQLWIRRLDSLEARALPGTEGSAGVPFWSPDSQSLGFFASGVIKRVDVAGGAPQVICDTPQMTGAAWGSDGRIIFGTGAGGLLQVPATGGPSTALTELDASAREVTHRWPQFLPDEKRFIYLAQPGNFTYMASTAGGKRVRLLQAESNALYAAPGYLLFYRRGSFLAQPFDPARGELLGEPVAVLQDVGLAPTNARATASVSQTGVLVYRGAATESAQLQWFDRKGTTVETIGDPMPYNQIAISRNGRYAVVGRTDLQRDLWTMDLTRGIFTKFTSGSAAESEPQWSPDGTEIAFASTRDGAAKVFRKKISGEGTDTVVDGIPESAIIEDWSTDGRYMAYIRQNGIWILPMFGDRKPFLFLQSRTNLDESQFSPDVRWIAYTSNESGSTEIYIKPFPGPGERIRISIRGGHQPRWSGNGKEIFFLAADGTLMAAAVGAAGTSLVMSAPQPLFKLQVPVSGAVDPYAVTPDGQRFLVGSRLGGTAAPPLKVVVNWPGLLKK